MTAKAANEARERLLGLLAEQHTLGMRAGAESEERYVAVSVEILKLAKTADLSPVMLSPHPAPPP